MFTTSNRAMLIGSIGAGKSTLTNALLGRNVEAVKTQSLHYYDWIVDTPGEYVENPYFYKSIMATVLEVTHVLFIQDATNRKITFPPSFSSGMPKLTIGVVTKADADHADIGHAISQLKRAIVQGPIVVTSSIKNDGIEELRELVTCSTYNEMKEFLELKKNSKLFYHESLFK
ncbi:EutP/PduV family microcompartment system protein [Neobacillus ginsengisoli]|uniref:Ethanolamine utilization protein EutP n=1 Tax=Neobacillus ginsengisoli TaxID=904295 RepID=A0ABT9XV88_9BACI|nr:EutP/PduV family microcompartment system protein [Neobacillus ginsengisoli]MDQ0199492.1 ethanolamine utilization protein EutP [Neobacillus ginsengisoli]